MSVPTSTVPNMDDADSVDPGDAALQAVLADIADRMPDEETREKMIDHILTVPSLKHWPTASLLQLQKTCTYVAGLSRRLRQEPS